MKSYSFSPIKSENELLDAITYTHFVCFELCKQTLGKYLSVAGNIGIFCHYDDEYQFLTKLLEQLIDNSDSLFKKSFRLHKPIVIPARGEVPETTYTYLYIRKPDPYRHHVGDVDFILKEDEYRELKESLQSGEAIKGARVFERSDPDMVELYDPDVDALGYVRTKNT